MTAILQRSLPRDMTGLSSLPGVRPETGLWLRVDEAYAAQMAHRVALMAMRPDDVFYLESAAIPAAQELLDAALETLPDLGFVRSGSVVVCPDGRQVELAEHTPLKTLNHLFQNDFILMEKRADEHVLTGGILCFPASWRLSEKAGKPLTDIHVPVAEYTKDLARRVQRMFDGIQVGRPLWRFNQLWYDDAELFQPRSVQEPRPISGKGPFLRSERQTMLRLPETGAVVFAIHTYVLRRQDVSIATGEVM